MANIVNQSFTANGTWTAPAEVFNVRLISTQIFNPVTAYGTTSSLIASNGFTYAWGANTSGELGNGTVTSQSSPVQVLNSNTTQFIQLPVMNSSSEAFAITGSGDMYSWGNNASGQLGVGDVTPRSSPVLVLGSQKWASVYCLNGNSAFGVTQAGVAYGWGVNAQGQLGVGDVTPRSSPVAVLGGLTFSKVICAQDLNGRLTTLGLTTSGAAYAWGYNGSGQLGVGDVTPRSSPVAVLGGLTFVQIAIDFLSGTNNTGTCFGLTASGQAYAWGVNALGQLGVGDVTPRSSPVAVLGGLTFTSLFVCGGSAFGLTSAGVLYGWGLNNNGQLGLGDVASRSSPVAVLGGLTFKQFWNIGEIGSLAITTSGQAYSWGLNNNGQLGLGDVASRSSPVAVLGGLTFANLYAGAVANSVFGVTTTGQVYSWGLNSLGFLGVGDTTPRSSPVAILGGYSVQTQGQQFIKDLQVVPGTTYSITIQNPIGFFGSTPLGPMLNQITVQYQQ